MLGVLVLGYLRKHARGRATARTQARIAADLRGLGLDVTSRAVRNALADLVRLGAPVGTTPAKPPGAFLCEDRADFLAAYRNLAIRFRAQAARARRFRETARAALDGQRTFDFWEADGAFAELERAPLLVMDKPQ
jgi:transposase